MRKRALAEVAAALATLLAFPAGAAQQAGRSSGEGRGTSSPAKAPNVVVVTPAAVPSPTSHSVPIISLSVKDADLVEVVRSLARIAGINVIFQPGVSGKVTAELVNVRCDHALSVILKTQGLGMEIDGRILTVAAPARLAGGG
jgi:type II secretory pathway component HofQ